MKANEVLRGTDSCASKPGMQLGKLACDNPETYSHECHPTLMPVGWMGGPSGFTDQTVAANGGWLKFGKITIIIALIFWTLSFMTESEELESIASFSCCLGLVALCIAGIIGGTAGIPNQQVQQLGYVQSSPQTVMITTQHSPPIPPGMNIQSVVTALEQKKRDAELESEKLRKQLASKSTSDKQVGKMEIELARLQESMADAENTKIQMQGEMDELRKSGGDSSVQMQDSVIGGDSIVGSTHIESQIVNDPEAIARAAIEAYRMAKNEEND